MVVAKVNNIDVYLLQRDLFFRNCVEQTISLKNWRLFYQSRAIITAILFNQSTIRQGKFKLISYIIFLNII